MHAYRATRVPPRLRPIIPGIQDGRRYATTATVPSSESSPLNSVLIANRGEIALRVAKTAAEYGIRTTTVYTDPDARAQHAQCTPFSFNLSQPAAYLDGERIIDLAKREGCHGIHPGYGFLSENSAFARRCIEEGLIFIGPPWKAIEAMGNKSESKNIMNAAGVPCIPGYHGSNQDPAYLEKQAGQIGYPVLLKAVKGGGGKGMRIVESADKFQEQLASAQSEARNSFGDDVMLVEKYISTPRHIEVQVFADKHGNCVALGERDCSIQRRHQKILEESPAPHLDQKTRYDLWDKACAAALAVNYQGAGTVEFIFDNETGKFFFMEMNTRLQVEHPVTEMVTGQDLVHWQFLVAAGEKLPLTQEEVEFEIAKRGSAIEARIYAENPDMNFIPDSGHLTYIRTPKPTSSVRIDAGFIEGDEVSSHYDPMIAKLIVQGPSREAALRKLGAALADYKIVGPVTNIDFLSRVCRHAAFIGGDVETGFIQKYHDDLFTASAPPNEAFVQAALATLLHDLPSDKVSDSSKRLRQLSTSIGFGSKQRDARQIALATVLRGAPVETPQAVNVSISRNDIGSFTVRVGENCYEHVSAEIFASPAEKGLEITSYFPHTRIASTVVRDSTADQIIHVFQRGAHHRFQILPPAWYKKALDVKETTNSILAPMPCKILRVDVSEGDTVKKDQPLIVIESMKMETVIRSPMAGVVSKIVHRAGDLCKAGTALVEFESESDHPQ